MYMYICVCCCVAGGISDADKKRTTQLVSHYREGKEVHWSLYSLVKGREVYCYSGEEREVCCYRE